MKKCATNFGNKFVLKNNSFKTCKKYVLTIIVLKMLILKNDRNSLNPFGKNKPQPRF